MNFEEMWNGWPNPPTLTLVLSASFLPEHSFLVSSHPAQASPIMWSLQSPRPAWSPLTAYLWWEWPPADLPIPSAISPWLGSIAVACLVVRIYRDSFENPDSGRPYYRSDESAFRGGTWKSGFLICAPGDFR